MSRIVEKRPLTEEVTLFRVEAPEIARRRRAGQFAILRLGAEGERIPLTLVDSDPEAGTVTLVVQAVGATTKRLAAMKEGEDIPDLAGPLGHATPVRELGTVAVVAGGVGAAEALPVIKAWRGAGNRVTAVVGARTADLLILSEELRTAADELHLCTEDGTLGKRGLVTDLLHGLINDGAVPDLVYAIGPVPMMKAVADLTRPYGIPTLASLNPIMVDGTGMCGCCRVTVGGAVKFACVDGPDFDAHQVDFGELRQRQGAYRKEEREADSGDREGGR